MHNHALPNTYWSQPIDDLLVALRSSPAGLSAADARERLAQLGPNALDARRRMTVLGLLLGQLKSPLVLILVFAAAISAVVHERDHFKVGAKPPARRGCLRDPPSRSNKSRWT